MHKLCVESFSVNHWEAITIYSSDRMSCYWLTSFEKFHDICLNYYKLDPAHFYTSPGLSWQACLRMTNMEMVLLTDPDLYLFIEEGLRGGISMISKRYSKANNPYVGGYDKDPESNDIM